MKKTILLLFVLVVLAGAETPLATIRVEAGYFNRVNTPVCLPLDNLQFNQDAGLLRLYEKTATGRFETPCQLENGHTNRLWWILDDSTIAGAVRFYELVIGDTSQAQAPTKIFRDEQKLVVLQEDKKVLQYNHAVVYPPAGVDDVFKRSGFIHPLWSPEGNVLTSIQPPDHYHHYGIWGPWTRTLFEGRSVDFWNLGEGQGTVEFAGYVAAVEGPVFAGFAARQEHIDFSAKGADKVALDELLDVRVWNLPGKDNAWLIDYTTTFNCASSSPVELEAYRYGGGIGFRAVEAWTNQNVRILTSAGKTRLDADGTRAMWCDVSGANENGERSGIVFMSHPANREHPEPMRIWPVDANNGRGDMFFEFCPIRHNSWKLLPGQNYVLKYRMMVYDGEVTSTAAEQVWRDFASPPRVTMVAE